MLQHHYNVQCNIKAGYSLAVAGVASRDMQTSSASGAATRAKLVMADFFAMLLMTCTQANGTVLVSALQLPACLYCTPVC
jgi:hypothetical protein